MNQTFIGGPLANGQIAGSSDRFTGFMVGLKLPILYGSYAGEVKAKKLRLSQKELNLKQLRRSLESQIEIQIQKILNLKVEIDYYQKHGLKEADLNWRNSQERAKQNDINYLINLDSFQNSLKIHSDYAESLKNYNEAIIELLYLKSL